MTSCWKLGLQKSWGSSWEVQPQGCFIAFFLGWRMNLWPSEVSGTQHHCKLPKHLIFHSGRVWVSALPHQKRATEGLCLLQTGQRALCGPKALGDSKCNTFLSRLGVRCKPLQITWDYKPVGNPPEITGLDAVSFPLSAAAIHQCKSKRQRSRAW